MRKYRKSKKKNTNLTFLCAINLFLVSALFFQFNILTIQRFESQNKEKLIKELSLNNEKLCVGLVQKNHIQEIENIAQGLNFEKPEKIHYLKIITSSIATK